MKKTVYTAIELSCILQQDSEISTDKCLNGVISPTEKGFRFEEAIRKGRAPRNPKLFDGDYISLVRMQNGKYQCHLKTFDPCGSGNAKELAFKVYSEMINAFKRFE